MPQKMQVDLSLAKNEGVPKKASLLINLVNWTIITFVKNVDSLLRLFCFFFIRLSKSIKNLFCWCLDCREDKHGKSTPHETNKRTEV